MTVMVTCPEARSVLRAARPLNRPLAGGDGGAGGVVVPAPATEPASSVTGVPARRAQPGCSGPTAANATVASGRARQTAEVANTLGRRPARISRQPSVQVTAATQAASRASNQGSLLSVPVPSPCHSAIGQDA